MTVRLRFIADMADLLKGVASGEESVEGFADSLEDTARKFITLSRDAGKASDTIARDLAAAFGIPFDRAKKAVQEVLGETEKLGDEGAKALKEAGDAGDDLGKKIGAAGKDAGESLTELGSIARDVLAGDLTGAADSAGSVLSSLASSILPGVAGAALGVAGSLGIGAIVAAFEEANARQERMAALAADWAKGIVDGSLDVTSALGRMAARNEQILGNYQEVVKYSDAWGVSTDVAAGALAGVPGDLATVDGALADVEESAARTAEKATAMGGAYGNAASQLIGAGSAASEGRAKFDELTDAAAMSAEQISQISANSLRAIKEAGADAIVTVDDLGNTVAMLPDGKVIALDADGNAMTAVKDLDSYKLAVKTQGFDVKDADALAKLLNVNQYTLGPKPVRVEIDDTAVRAYQPPSKTMYITTRFSGDYPKGLLG